MKNTIKLLLTISTTPFLINCTGKPLQAQLPTISHPIPTTETQRGEPSIGTPIFIPNSTPKEIPSTETRPDLEENIPKGKIPTVEQVSKYGQSYYSEKFKLPSTIKETSGLIKLDNKLWTLNDSGGKAALYQIDERNGHIIKTLNILNAKNRDWEDIAYDDNYVYIGDIGNNRGNRRDLKIYKIPRAALNTQSSSRAEIISFHYSDQKDFKSRPQQNNFDCEAMIAHNGKLYLFSKNWKNQQTRLYELSTQAGKQTANYINTFNTQGMVTGATINEEMNILLLTTYSPLLNVNVWAFTNFNGRNLLWGNAKKLKFTSPLNGQVEGITFRGNYKAYLSSEAFRKYIFSFDSLLYTLDFSGEFE